MSEKLEYPKYRWFVLVAMFVITAGTSVAYIGPAPLIPTIFQTMGWDPGVTLIAVMMVANLATAISALLGGILVDKLGIAKTWLIGTVLIILGSVLVYFIGGTFSGLVIARVVQTAGIGPILGSIASACAQWFKYNERMYVAAVQGFAVNIGIAIAFLYGPAMYTATGNWQSAIALLALPNVVGFIFALIVVLGPKPPTIINTVEDKSAERQHLFRKALGGITIYILVLMAFFDSWTQQAFNDVGSNYYAANVPLGLGFGPVKAGALLALAPIFSALGTLVAPVLTEKVFKGKPAPTVFIGLIVGAIAVFVVRFLQPTQDALLTIVPCIIMFFTSFVNPTVYGYVAKKYPAAIAGKLGGLAMGIGVFGATLGVGISGALVSGFKSYIPSMNVMAIVCIIGALLAFALRPPKGFVTEGDDAAHANKLNKK